MMGTAAVQSVDEATVLAAARGLVAAFARHDTRAYFDAFAPEASFIFHSTPAVLPSRAAYEQLWADWEQTLGFEVAMWRCFTTGCAPRCTSLPTVR